MHPTFAPSGTAARPQVGWAVPWAAVVNVITLVGMLITVSLRGGAGPASPGAALIGFTLAGWLPLLFRERWPLPVLGATVAISAAQLVFIPALDPNLGAGVAIAGFQPLPIAVMVAAYTAAALVPGRTGWLAGCLAALGLPLVAAITQPAGHMWTNLVMANLILDGTAVGVLVAARRERLTREQRELAERTRIAVEHERLRISRELHDVLAHHLTLVNAQAGVAEYLLGTDPAAAGKALAGLAKHTRQALDELRATVGLLRDTAPGEAANRPPLPTLAELPQLLESVRAAGSKVDLTVSGDPAPLAPGVDLAAYRVVQEALTNATKHAAGARVTVGLDWEEPWLRIRIENPAQPEVPLAQRPPGSGLGLLGMAERVRAAGGAMTVDRPPPGRSGRFVLTVSLPTESEPR